MLRALTCSLAAFLLLVAFLSAQNPGEKKPDPKGEVEKKKKELDPFKPLKFRNIGPAAGGRVSRSCGVPGEPGTMYVGSASGGVWKTTDGGNHWKAIFDDQSTSSIGAVAVAASDTNVVYVGTGEANIRGNVQKGEGVFRSTNGGKTWQHVLKIKGQIGQLAIDPRNAEVCFAALLGSPFGPGPDRGVYRTTDGGKTWKQVLKKDADTGAIDVVLDPTNPRIVFAALWQTRRSPWSMTSGGPGSGIYRSDDGGDTWKQLDPGEDGLPEGPWGRIGLAISPSNPDRIYALIEAEKGGLYRSDDGGETWKLINKDRYLRQRAWYFSTLTVDPTNSDVVWACSVRLLKSTDGGKSFKNVVGPHHSDHHDIWIDPKNSSRILDSHDGGLDVTLDGGGNWTLALLPIAQFYHISTDTSVPYRVMGNMQDQGTASGPSNNLTTGSIPLSDWHQVGGGETGYSVADPRDPNIVYAGEYAGILTRYDHRTKQAAHISAYPTNPSGRGAGELKYRFQWTAPLLISPHDPDTVYHAANVLFATKDAGKTWKAISPDLTRDDKKKQTWTGGPITGDNTGVEYFCTIFAIAESPKKKGLLWAGSDDGLVHVSLDGGGKWTDVTKNIPGLPEWGTVACIEASRFDEGTAYVVVDAHRLDDDRPYLWKTTDYGKSWKSLTTKLPKDDYLRVVREDTVVPGLLWLGSEHGLHVSRDDGVTWDKLKFELPTVAVSDLVVKGNDLVVGTNGRSIYIFDDVTPIRQWSPKMLTSGPHLFPVQKAIRWRLGGDSYVPEDKVSGDNPPHGAILTYWLDKKPKADLVLEIADEKGTLVRRMTSKKVDPDYEEDHPDRPWSLFKPTVLSDEPGLQRVTWNLEWSGPKIIPNAKNDAGIPYHGPLVLPGKYMAKLTIDGKSMTQPIEVVLDPRVKLAAGDLEERHQLGLKIRSEIWKLTDIVVGIRSLRSQVVQRQEIWKDEPKAEKALAIAKEFEKKLDALEESLHNPDAEVFYDILAMKGGAKLYSQYGLLYDFVKSADAPVTQGMHEESARLTSELKAGSDEWNALLSRELVRFNELARELSLPAALPPRPGEFPPNLMRRRS